MPVCAIEYIIRVRPAYWAKEPAPENLRTAMASDPDAGAPRAGGERIIIQKYANRRLYNKATSSYITLEDLSRMVKEGQDFEVRDAKSGEDITRKVLTQIIFEEE